MGRFKQPTIMLPAEVAMTDPDNSFWFSSDFYQWLPQKAQYYREHNLKNYAKRKKNGRQNQSV